MSIVISCVEVYLHKMFPTTNQMRSYHLIHLRIVLDELVDRDRIINGFHTTFYFLNYNFPLEIYY